MQWTTCGPPFHNTRQMLKFKKQPDNNVGKIPITSFWIQRTNPALRNPCAKSCWKLGGSSEDLSLHPALLSLSTQQCDKVLDKRLDKMPLCVVMLGQVLNIPHCLDYTSVCSQQVISGYRKPTSGSRLSPLFSFFWHIVGVCIPTWVEEWFPALVQFTE